MTCFNSECLGNSDFERIARHARRRFVEGIDTVTLMQGASSERERREIALAALLDLDEATIAGIELFACDSLQCRAREYRQRLRRLLSLEQPLIAVGF
ncbi:hypothetical protein [Motiliproteus sediminis]|uniref:hypothetical protein n=1 Tax=Motiliproteus sediminis TaxID=1468178 RepID=UPI001AEF38CF|nr:hypothetical protein [Motiliproteus sediminis]